MAVTYGYWDLKMDREKRLRNIQQYYNARQGIENWTVDDWMKYAKSDALKVRPLDYGTYGRNPGATRLFGGGYLTEADYSAATWAQNQALKNEYQTKYDEAKLANEQRYKDILGGYDTMYGTQQGMMEGMGDAERAQLERIAGRGYAQNADTAVKGGMLNTTVLPALNRQTARQHAENLALLNDRYNKMRLGAYTDYMTGKMGVMERREDEYPDFNQLIALARGLGNA